MSNTQLPLLLTGAKAIGNFLGLTERQVLHRVETGDLSPVFRLGKTLCARPETLRQWIERQEAGQ